MPIHRSKSLPLLLLGILSLLCLWSVRLRIPSRLRTWIRMMKMKMTLVSLPTIRMLLLVAWQTMSTMSLTPVILILRLPLLSIMDVVMVFLSFCVPTQMARKNGIPLTLCGTTILSFLPSIVFRMILVLFTPASMVDGLVLFSVPFPVLYAVCESRIVLDFLLPHSILLQQEIRNVLLDANVYNYVAPISKRFPIPNLNVSLSMVLRSRAPGRIFSVLIPQLITRCGKML